MAQHSKRYKNLVEKIDKEKEYTLKEGIAVIKETATTKFDSGIELHVKLGIDAIKGDQQVRNSVVFPHNAGKTQRVAVFTENVDAAKKAGADIVGGEELVKEIKASKKIDFDVAVAEPTMMKALGGVARILGPKGLMPSPKEGTVTTDVVKAIEEIKKGKTSFKNDDSGNIHILVGRASFTEDQIQENIELFLDVLKRSKPEGIKGVFILKVSLTSSMGPGVRVTI